MRVIAIVAAVVLGSAAPAFAADTEAIERARAAVMTEYQTELPGHDEVADPQAPPPELARGATDTRDRRTVEPGVLGELLSFLLYGCAIVGLVLGVIWLARELASYTDNAKLAPDDAAPPSEAETAAILERPLGDADELARRGELAAAIHTLLLRTLQELVRSAAVKVARSDTSREILARVPLLADARDALAGLITAVEITHFGDEPATAADYERCRQQFHRFADAFRARSAAGARA